MDAILVDASHLLYRSAHTFTSLENKAGHPTGVHFGVMRAIEHLKKACPNSFIVFTLDGRSDARRELFPAYKGNRKDQPETHGDIVHDFGMRMDITSLVKAAGCAIVHHPHYESDDLIGMLAYWPAHYLPINELDWKMVIYSGDDDFCQLVTKKVSILKPPAGKNTPERWMTEKEVQGEWGVWPESMALYRSFLGDSGDNIPRIPRIPRDRLQMAVAGKTCVSQFYDSDGLAYFNPEWKRKLTEFRSQAEINERLTRLPWAIEDVLPIEYDEYGCNIGNLKTILEKLEFSSFLKKIGALEELLGPTSYAKAVSSLAHRSKSRQNPAPGLEGASSGS
jgi:5'-3' exonuclease